MFEAMRFKMAGAMVLMALALTMVFAFGSVQRTSHRAVTQPNHQFTACEAGGPPCYTFIHHN